MISTNDAKQGMAVKLDDGLFQIVEQQHVKPGKGKAFVRMKLKNLDSGAVIDRTFRAGESIDDVRIDRRDFQYLYKDDMGLHFMDLETFEQMPVSRKLLESAIGYLVEGMTVQLSIYDGSPIGVELGTSVELKVVYAEPGVKGDRVSGATKPVTLETDLIVQAPLFVEQGDVIKVDTRSGEYLTRVT